MGLFKPNIAKMLKKKDIEGLIKTLKHKDRTVRHQAARSLVTIGEPAIKPLTLTFKNSDRLIGELILGIFIKIGQPAVNAISLILNEGDAYYHRLAVKTLGKIGDVRAVDPLIQALNPRLYSNEVRKSAATALGNIGDIRAVDPLIQLLNDKYFLARLEAATALGKIRDGKAVDPLIQLLKDINNKIRLNAAIVLGKIGDVRAVDPLIQALKEEDDRIRKEIEETDKIEDKFIRNHGKKSLEKKKDNVKLEIITALGEIGDTRIVDLLIQTLAKKNLEVKKRATVALGKTGDVRGVDPLIQVLKYAVSHSSESKYHPIEDGFLKKLNLKYKNIAVSAIRALGMIDDPRVINPLIEVLKERTSDGKIVDSYIIIIAIQTLGEIGNPKAINPLKRSLKSEDKLVSLNAAKALAKIEDLNN